MSRRPLIELPQMRAGAPQLPRFGPWGNRKPKSEALNQATAIVDGSIASLRIYRPITSWGGWFGISSEEVAEVLDDLPDTVTEIQVLINSPGGVAFEAIGILNLLRNHPATVTAFVEGLAASAASVIAVGVDKTVMCPNSQMMIHDASMFAFGTSADMDHASQFLDKLSGNIAGLYATKGGGEAADWRNLMLAETWYTDQEAVDAGLADSIGNPQNVDGEEIDSDSDDDDLLEGIDPFDPDDHWDLSVFRYAGRATAPAPAAIAAHDSPAASADGTTHPTEGSPAVAFSDEQTSTMRQQLGLGEDADEATIVAALAEALAEQTGTGTTPQLPEGVVTIEQSVLDQLRADATQGREARTQQLNEERDSTIRAAVADGRIAQNRVKAWTDAWNADADGARTSLAALEPGLIPVGEEIGHASGADKNPATASATDVREHDDYQNWRF